MFLDKKLDGETSTYSLYQSHLLIVFFFHKWRCFLTSHKLNEGVLRDTRKQLTLYYMYKNIKMYQNDGQAQLGLSFCSWLGCGWQELQSQRRLVFILLERETKVTSAFKSMGKASGWATVLFVANYWTEKKQKQSRPKYLFKQTWVKHTNQQHVNDYI